MKGGMPSGDLDKRVRIERDTVSKDDAGDEVHTWGLAFKRWAKRKDLTVSGRMRENTAPQVVLRDSDTMWVLRYDSQSLLIAPEEYRLVHHDKVYEIVGIGEESGREVGLLLLTASRPDKRGSAGPARAEAASG
jgi:head-tail adaptor